MALFPAYGSDEDRKIKTNNLLALKNDDVPSDAVEVQLLASDTEEQDTEKVTHLTKETSVCSRSESNTTNEFYLDNKSDYGNLNVSTLYYPGRPEYRCRKNDYTTGAKYICKEKRERRYFMRCLSEDSDAPAITERAEAYQRLLAENPEDLALWEKFIDFQERCGTPEAALAAAERAAARHPGAPALRRRLLDALRAALPPPAQLRRLRELLAGERDASARVVLWERVLRALAAEPSADADALTAAAAAAMADTRAAPHSYPRLLYAAGAQLRAAGLWERLVLLIELAVGMNHSGHGIPAPDPQRAERNERRLAELEDKVTTSGLPLSAVWVRVERARAAAHWRPAAERAAPADPQRLPRAHLLADLLQPLVADAQLLQLSVRLLLLAKVPLVPGTDWTARALGGAEADCAEALLPLVWAARELPAAHPARAPPALARRLLALALDPPHYFSDESGYLGWVDALWDACCAAARGPARAALLGWRLRWLRAQLLLTADDAAGRAERERVRQAARAVLRRLRCAEPLAVAELARLELLAAPARAAASAQLALRSAVAAGAPEHALYVARIAGEISPEASASALVSAVLGRMLPADAPPSPEDCAAALQRCEERCEELERALLTEDGEEEEEDACAALLPGAGEWARARAALAPPPRRRRLLGALGALARAAPPRARRYCEEAAEALARVAAADACAATAARALAPLFPHNAYLALASAGAPLWAWQAQSQEERLRSLAPRGDVAELALALPPLLRALGGAEPFADGAAAEAAARALRRATGGARGARAGALLWALRLEAEARAPRPRLPHALFAALDAAPAHKWLYVRGAAWSGGAAEALEDALLERQLRLHALRDELRAPDAGP